MAVPICNGLTFLFTAITAWALGEKVDSPVLAASGSVLILAGVTVCAVS